MCFEKLLGLKSCSQDEPVTGLFIDELGISTTFLGQLYTDQYSTGVDLFIEKRAFAWRKLSSDVLTRLSPSMKADTIVEGRRIGQVLTNASNEDLSLGIGRYGGIRVVIEPNNLSFLSFYLSDLSIQLSDATLNTNVYVFDMTSLKLIDTINYQTGGVDQFIGKVFNAKRRKLDLAFVYESLEDTIKIVSKKGSCFDCGGSVRAAHICPFVDAIGIELTTDGLNVLSSINKKYTQGMSFNYNVNCDRANWLCSVGGLMALPLAYATAVEIYDYALMVSPMQRVNTTIDLHIESIQQAREIAAVRYSEELNAVLGNMRLPEDSHCFDCRKNYRYVTAI